MADNVISSFLVALGFDVNQSSLNTAKKSVADYEKAVRDAEKRIEDARWEGAKSEEEIAKLSRETSLKEARAALANAQDKEKSEKDLAKKRQDRAREFATAMSKMALAATAAATAIGYAVAKVSSSFDNLYFQAQRAGTSVQSLKALGYAFSQTGGTAQQAGAAVDSFTTALRNNPGLRQFVKDLGVSDSLQGVDKLLATVDALKKEPYEVGVQHAGMLGISEENFNLLSRQGEALKQYRAEYDETTKRLGLNSKEAADASVAFQRALTRLQATVAVIGEKLLVQLAPALEKVAKGFTDWLAANPEKVDHILKSISDAIVWLSQKIAAMVEWFSGSDGAAFLKRWDDFSSRVAMIAHGFEAVWAILQKIDGWLEASAIYKLIAMIGSGRFGLGGVIQDYFTGRGGGGGAGGPLGVGAVGGFNPLEGGGKEGQTPPDDRSLWQRVAPKILGGKDAPAAGDGSRSFRNNNPGNLKMGAFARSMGATEADDKGFARFPSYEAGRKAQQSLLFDSDGYKGLTIQQAIAKWAPGSDGNDPAGYAAQVAKAAGVGVDTKLSDLSPEQRNKFLDAQQTKEGWISAATPGGATGPLTTDGPVRANLMHGQYGGIGENLTELRSASGLRTQVHAEAQPSFSGFLKELEAQGYNVQSLGGYNPRRIRGGSGWSQHAYGNAIDLNPGKNPLGSSMTDMPDGVRALAKKYGLIWGMDWKGRKDPMHFEWNGSRPWLDEQKAAAVAAAKAYTAPAPAENRNDPVQSAAKPPAINMTPGGFDVNKIDPRDLMKAPPMGAGGVNNTSTSNKAVTQHITSNTTIHEARNTKEAGRVMEGAFGRMHNMALSNAQSAVA